MHVHECRCGFWIHWFENIEKEFLLFLKVKETIIKKIALISDLLFRAYT